MTRERIAFVASLLLAALVAYLGLTGKSAPQTWTPSKGDRANYEPAGVPTVTLVDEKIARYWEGGGSSPFVVVSDKRDLPPQDIDLPPATVGNPALPEFDPAPDPEFLQSPEALAMGAGAARVPHEPTGRPVPAVADLPPMSDLEALRDAALQALADTPHEEVTSADPKFDTIVLKSGMRKEGTILDETPNDVTMRIKGGGVVKFERKDILSVTTAQGPAAEYREASRKIASGDAKARFELAQTCIEKKLEAEAAQELDLALQADPKFIKAYIALADLHRSRTDLDAELQVLGRALKAGVLNIEVVHLRMGEIYGRLGLAAESLAALESAVRVQPSYVPARVALGQAYIDARRYEDALEHLEKARSLAAQDPTVQAALARYAFRRLELDAALAAADQSLAKDPAQARLLNLRGVALAYQGKYADAAKAFTAALKASPFISSAWVNLGILYALAEKLDEATLLFDEARKLDPAAAVAVAAGGALAHLKGHPDDARAAYESALLIDPTCYYAHYGLGHASLELGEIPTAAQELTLSLKQNTGFAGALYSAGVAFLRDRKFARAVRLLKRVTGLEPGRPRAFSSLGIAYLGANEPEKADGALREALRLDPDHGPGVAGLAYAAFFGGHGQEAIAKFSRVLELKSDDPSVGKALAALQEHATRALGLVKESATRTLWEDTFERSDREDIGRSWFEAERNGVQVGIKDNHVLFQGTQAVADNGITSLHRVVVAETFLRVEAEVDVTDAGHATVGVFLESKSENGSKSGVYFGRNEKNRLQYAFAVEAGDVNLRWQDLGVDAEGKSFRLGVERAKAEDGGRAWQFLLNGKAVDLKKSPTFNLGENFTAGAFGQAMRGEKWSLRINRMRMIEEKRK